MRRLQGFARVASVLALAAALVMVAQSSAAAADSATLTLHKRICPAGQTGDIFTACHDNLPTQTVSFTVDDGAAQDVGADGNVTFTDLAAGTHAVAEVEGPPLDAVNLRVWCSVQSPTVTDPVEIAVDLNAFDVTLGAGETVVCDVYNVAEDLSGRTPTATSTVKPTTGASQLPATGTGDGSATDARLLLTGVLALVVLAVGLGSLLRTTPGTPKH